MIVNTGQPPPGPWDIPINPNKMFVDQVVKVEIPNTAHIEV